MAPQIPFPSPTIDEIIADYLQAAETGHIPDQRALLARYPEHAEALALFLETDLKLRQPTVDWTLQTGARERPQTAPPIKTLGQYELLEEVARGGMGIVYKARQTRLNRTVALKMILTGQLAHETEVRRFRAEAEAAAGLEHPGIVPILEIADEEGYHYYTMSYIDGESLAERLARDSLPPDEAAVLMHKVASAVAYAHRQRVLHRDLKPANILIDPNGEPKITDFGLAKSLDGDHDLTATGEILGTLQFMAPEQAAAQHDQVAETADVYSLGAILFRCLTGNPVFAATSHVDLLLQVLEGEPISPRRLAPAVPAELEAICLRCLEKDPKQRYPTAQELTDDLARFLSGEPILATAGTFRNRARRWIRQKPLLAAHIGALLLVELFRITYFFGNDTARDASTHFRFSFLFAGWIAGCFAFQRLHDQPRRRDTARYLWSAADVAMLTTCLYLVDNSIAMLLASFLLLVVSAGLFMRVRLVWFVTANCVLALLLLLWTRPGDERTPLHLQAIFIAVLLAIAAIVGFQVRRMRTLSQIYERNR